MNYIALSIIPIIVLFIIFYGMANKVKIYECFVEGALDGVKICLRIFPYLLAMLFAVAIFRTSGAMDILSKVLNPVLKLIGLPPDVLPLVLIKPLSGSGSIGIYTDIIKKCGPDSFSGRLASIVMGSTETIFYTLSVYFGAVKIKKIRHTLWAAVFADITSVIIAIFITRKFL